MAQYFPNSQILPSFFIEKRTKSPAKYQKILISQVLEKYHCTYSSQLLERLDEDRGSLFGYKKRVNARQMERRTIDGLASVNVRWLYRQRS